MRQQFEFSSYDLEKLAENADALMSWLEQGSASAEASAQDIDQTVKNWRVKIPAHLLLVSATTTISGLTVWLDQQLPNSACWFGNCSNV
ncbi:MAG TPA: hypothetical protein PLD25_31275 [Chloroflexota bacterium]|nr:hypothetical protein [Chloroflexota bacterium]HUM67528.1 hypothetical protein [Chloroflexota bacterium]